MNRHQELPATIGPLFRVHHKAHRNKAQCKRLLAHFKAGGTITTFEAYAKFGITQLGRCIDDLKKAGYRFNRPRVRVGDTIVCRYSLERESNETY